MTDQTTTAQQPKRKRTRKKAQPHVAVDVEASRCRTCGSSSRGDYFNKTEKPLSGIDEQGLPFTHVVWRSCKCLDCGQIRRERSRENRTK